MLGRLVVDDLVAFLKARLDEDEAVARQAPDIDYDEPLFVVEGDETIHLGINPSRVLAEVEAKRRIVATFVELDAHPNRLTYAFMQQQWVALRAVVAALALPYGHIPETM
jgi:hypothetical protein